MFTICIFFLCSHYKTLGIFQGTSKQLLHRVEIPRSATSFEPGKFSSIFGSVRLFPINGLVKIRQTGQLYTCRLVNLRNGAIYRYRETGKEVTDLLTRHSSKLYSQM